jgi:AraC-like DNA-binding protein
MFATTPTLSVEFLEALSCVAKELNLQLADVFKEIGLDSTLLSAANAPITAAQLESLFLAMERLSGCDSAGFQVGRRCGLASTGLAGRAATCEETTGHGLRVLIEQCNLHDASTVLQLQAEADVARFTLTVCEHGMWDMRHMQLKGMAIAHNILCDLFGPGWQPKAVVLASRGPTKTRDLENFFRTPLEFDGEESHIAFDRHWLERPLPPVEPSRRLEVAAALRRQRASTMGNLPVTLRRVLRKRLRIGSFAMDDVAAQFAIHRRTLDRRLQRHGTTYGELLEDLREEIARQLLCDTRLPIRSIAESVRFSSAANFATSFRRRVGMTPTEFRRQMS